MKFIGKTIVHAIFTAFLFILTPEYGVAQVAEPAQGKARPNNSEWVRLTIEEYIMQWRHLAIENMEIYGIPASITMGQAILESGFGNGYLARTARVRGRVIGYITTTMRRVNVSGHIPLLPIRSTIMPSFLTMENATTSYLHTIPTTTRVGPRG